MRLAKTVATRQDFEALLNKKPLGLHFSGHGIPNKKETFGGAYFKKYDTDGDSLVFENFECTGEADFVSQKDLK